MNIRKITACFIAAALLAGGASADSILGAEADLGGDNSYTWSFDVDRIPADKSTLDALPGDMVAYLIDANVRDAKTDTGYKQFASVTADQVKAAIISPTGSISVGDGTKDDGRYIKIDYRYKSDGDLMSYYQTSKADGLRTVIVSASAGKALVLEASFGSSSTTISSQGYFEDIIVVPEPTSGALALLGLAFVAFKRKCAA